MYGRDSKWTFLTDLCRNGLNDMRQARGGYQVSGYYSCHSLLGTPDDLKYLIDLLHQAFSARFRPRCPPRIRLDRADSSPKHSLRRVTASISDHFLGVRRPNEAEIGVIMDYVPAHFCKDACSFGDFDGTPTYEYEDPREGEQRQWGTKAG